MSGYEINGCMRFGTATITLTKGEVKPVSLKENDKDKELSKNKELPKYRTVAVEDLSESEIKGLSTYYFTFGSRQVNEGMYQPIMAKDMSTAYEKMLEMYGTKWASHYNQDKWNNILKDWGQLYEGKDLKIIAVLDA